MLDAAAGQASAGAIERALSARHPPALVRPVVLHLLWTGRLRADLTRPLSADTPVRLEAADLIEAGAGDAGIARQLRVSRMSVNRWRQALASGGREALASKGAGGAKCRLTDAQVAELEAALEAGPAECGHEDQRWTLARIADLAWQRFGAEYTLAGMDLLLHRLGWSVQAPARRAAERDETAIAAWREETWPAIKGPSGSRARGWSSRMSPARG